LATVPGNFEPWRPVPDLELAVLELNMRGVEVGVRFEIPHGPGVEVVNPGPQRVALYQHIRQDASERLSGRRDSSQGSAARLPRLAMGSLGSPAIGASLGTRVTDKRSGVVSSAKASSR
jgi:hypothetical protein